MMKLKKIWMALLTAVLCCALYAASAEDAGPGVWIAYWDWEAGVEEAEDMAPLPERLIAFGALFSPEERVILEPEAEEMLQAMQARFPAERIYLSVINDLTLSEGGYSNKDRELLRRLLSDPEKRAAHVTELTELAESLGLKGLEIDYENIHADPVLWESFTAFLQELYASLNGRGIGMRVCLEWDSILYAELPEGPEYSIMCYNLYGYHSGPGPKADTAFLQQVAELYAGRADCRMALATGGYDWAGDNVEKEVRETEAEKLFRSRNLKAVRDPDSGAMHGEYLKEGVTHSVWYADAETLRGWMKTLRDAGCSRFDLFRLGGNRIADWNEVFPDVVEDNEEGGVAP